MAENSAVLATGTETEAALQSLSDSQREAVATYCAVLESQSTIQAVSALSATRWNVQEAVERFLNGESSPTPDPVSRPSNVTTQRVSSPTGAIPSSTHARPDNHAQPVHWILRALFSPLRVLCAALRRINFSLWRLFGGHPRALADSGGGNASQRFRLMYEARHGTVHPAFFEGSLLTAISTAQTNAVFLLVYLHSESNFHTSSFCSRVLANPDFIAATQSSDILIWAADVSQRDGAAAQTALRASGFPYLALVNPPSRSVRSTPDDSLPPLSSANFGRVLSSLTAPYTVQMSVQDIIQWMNTAITSNRRFLDNVREARAARERDRQLIAEQNFEYEESLRADRERERRVQEEKQRAEEESRKVEERELRRRRKEEALGAEPDKGPGTCSIMLRLPDGARVQRRFNKEDCLENVFDWAEVNKVDIEIACLVTNYPRSSFRYPEDAGTTLGSAGLFPSAMLLLEEREDPPMS